MGVPTIRRAATAADSDAQLRIEAPLVADWLVRFLRHECVVRRGVTHAVLGLSGGVDSAVSAFLCARAFGAENVTAIRMPYTLSSQASLEHADLVSTELGIRQETLSIAGMVDALTAQDATVTPSRIGNICARARMTVLFDQAVRWGALPVGTGNKTERLFGYFTWHADDTPPINPLGDLFKTQVWALARELGVPDVIIDKPATADLVHGQTDEGDFGISYPDADRILVQLVQGRSDRWMVDNGFDAAQVALVRRKVESTHWKRRQPTVAMLSSSAIGESYLRPVDY